MRTLKQIKQQDGVNSLKAINIQFEEAKSELDASRGYTSWVIILKPRTEPIVKRCSNQTIEKEMMSDARKLHPEAQIICAQTNPGDPNELWACSEAHWKTVNEV